MRFFVFKYNEMDLCISNIGIIFHPCNRLEFLITDLSLGFFKYFLLCLILGFYKDRSFSRGIDLELIGVNLIPVFFQFDFF